MTTPDINCNGSDKDLLDTTLIQLILKRKKTQKECSSIEIIRGAKIPLESIGISIKYLRELSNEINTDGPSNSSRIKLHGARDQLRMIIDVLTKNKAILRAFEDEGIIMVSLHEDVRKLLNGEEDNPSLRSYMRNFASSTELFIKISDGLYECYKAALCKFNMLESAIEANHLTIGKIGFISLSTLHNGMFFVILPNNDTGEHLMRATKHGNYFVRENGKWFSEDQSKVPFGQPIIYCVPESLKSRKDQRRQKKREETLKLRDYSFEGNFMSFDSDKLFIPMNP